MCIVCNTSTLIKHTWLEQTLPKYNCWYYYYYYYYYYAVFNAPYICQSTTKSQAHILQHKYSYMTMKIVQLIHQVVCAFVYVTLVYVSTRDLAMASMARNDLPASSMASTMAAVLARRPQCAVKRDRNLKPKLAIMRQCTSVTDRRTLTS